jgi:uncharacterized protein (UPF0248 family)
MPFARDILGKLKWTGKLKGCEIIILHRGAPNDRKAIPAERITEIKRSYFCYMDERSRETVIPMHRVLEIRTHGKAVWQRVRSQSMKSLRRR